jgi:outer membrane protein insertion porin family
MFGHRSPSTNHLVIAVLTIAVATGAQAQLNRVAEVKLDGNSNISTEVIREVLAIKVGDEFAEEDVEADVAAIKEMGYFSAVTADHTRRHDGVVVVFHVTENALVTKVSIEGNKEIPSEKILEKVELKPGRVLHSGTVEKDVARLEEFYRSEGYLGKIVDVEIKGGEFVYHVQEAVIEDIQIEGLKKTRPFVVTREMKSRPGQVFNAKLLGRDLNKIFNLNIFEDVTWDQRPGAEVGKVIVTVQVKEKRTGMAAVGIGFSSRSELVGFADLDEVNFRGKGQKAALRMEFGDRKSWATSFFEPWVDQKHTSAGIELFDRLIYREPTGVFGGGLSDNSVFEERRKGGRLSFGRPKSDTVSYSIRLKNEKVSFKNTKFAGVTLPFGDTSGHVSSLTLGLAHDTRDIIMDPSTGGRESLELEWANSLLGGQDTFVKWKLDLRRYRPVAPKGVLAGRLQAGVTSGALPAYEQYFVGGAETIRGFNVDREYGKNMIVANVEYRHRFQKNFQAVAFVDYGGAYGGPPDRTDWASFDGLLGYGFGIRVKTPLGPIRLDLGFSEDGSRTHFSIGQMF